MLATRGTAMLTTLRSARAQALNWLLPAAGAALTVLGRAWLQSSPPLRLALEPCALAAPALPAEAAPADVGGSCDPSGSAWRRSWTSNLQADTERAGPAPWAADILLMAVPKRRTTYSIKRIRQNAQILTRGPKLKSHLSICPVCERTRAPHRVCDREDCRTYFQHRWL